MRMRMRDNQFPASLKMKMKFGTQNLSVVKFSLHLQNVNLEFVKLDLG